MSETNPPEVSPGTSVPTPPTQPPDTSLFPQAHPIVDRIPSQTEAVAPPPPPLSIPRPPVVVDEPYAVQQTGSNIATVTMGNWENEPHTYIYQWLRDGIKISGAVLNQYSITSADNGRTLTCIVTAINNGGGSSATSSIITAVYTPPTN